MKQREIIHQWDKMRTDKLSMSRSSRQKNNMAHQTMRLSVSPGNDWDVIKADVTFTWLCFLHTFILKVNMSSCTPSKWVCVDVRSWITVTSCSDSPWTPWPHNFMKKHTGSWTAQREEVWVKKRKKRGGTWTSMALQILSQGVGPDRAAGHGIRPAHAPIIHLWSEEVWDSITDPTHWINQQSFWWSGVD